MSEHLASFHGIGQVLQHCLCASVRTSLPPTALFFRIPGTPWVLHGSKVTTSHSYRSRQSISSWILLAKGKIVMPLPQDAIIIIFLVGFQKLVVVNKRSL